MRLCGEIKSIRQQKKGPVSIATGRTLNLLRSLIEYFSLIPVPVTYTVASTPATVFVLLDRTASATDMIACASEVIRMTSGAERFVLREGPRERTVDAVAVTAVTSRVHAVIARVVPIGIMAEDVRRPAVGRMAHVALNVRADVVARLGSRTPTGAVTVIASTGSTGIMEPGAADEGCSGMTEVAIQ